MKSRRRIMGRSHGDGSGKWKLCRVLGASSDVLAPTPDGLDPREADALPLVVTTGAQLIEHIRPKRGNTLLVTGALGNVGRTAVYVAKQEGARVIAGVRGKQN